MDRREEFLAKAIEAHREYEAVTAALREMMKRNVSSESEWLRRLRDSEQL